MSYRIRYKLIRKNRKENLAVRSILTVLCFFVFLVLVYNLWPDGKIAVEEGLAFLRPTVMISAMNEMAEDFQNGMNIAAAVGEIFNNFTQGEMLAAG